MDIEDLREITTIEQLFVYLRDELDWPLEDLNSNPFEELLYDWDLQEDLHLKSEHSTKIREVRQLPPLVTDQPWGIFYVSFEDKALRIGPLRQILRALIVNRRGKAKGTELRKWQLGDLIFISTFGDSGERQLCFAHFHQDPETGDLPVLRVLGWNDKDTRLHLADVHDKLKEYLKWPEDPSDFDIWREQWSKPFRHRPGEVISTSKDLAVALADLAIRIREAVEDVLDYQTDEGPMRQLLEAFKQNLIHDLDDHDFSDMFAQTIAYGLLTAKFSRPAGLIADNLVDMLPSTNVFLRELFETFFSLGGRSKRDALDFDVLGIRDVVDMLNESATEAVKRDFDDRNPDEDPTIHFYELFLKEYDPKKRIQRGVFYTPRPVVNFIVRSVDEKLRKDFNLSLGLADTTTWEEMIKRNKELTLPDGVRPDDPFVQILDPATGTGTFLVEVINIIHKRIVEQWKKSGKTKVEIEEAWNDYVPDHLLPRLNGFELMMAPYAIAHMKIGLKLFETGYRFSSDERARIFLTNALEPGSEVEPQFEELAPALAHEANAANRAKENKGITVLIGNPPYSRESANLKPSHKALVERYRTVRNAPVVKRGHIEFERSIQNDYVKFIALVENKIMNTHIGIFGLITSNSFLAAPNLAGMRESIFEFFSELSITNLHGYAQGSGSPLEGDQNVFEITEGVAISIANTSTPKLKNSLVMYDSLVGSRDSKFEWLQKAVAPTKAAVQLKPKYPNFLFLPTQENLEAEFYQERSMQLDEFFDLSRGAIVTARDGLVIGFTREEICSHIIGFRDAEGSLKDISKRYGANWSGGWKKEGKAERAMKAVKKMTDDEIQQSVTPIMYRPFDIRFVFYCDQFLDTPSRKAMSAVIEGESIGLGFGKTTRSAHADQFFCSQIPMEAKCAESTKQCHFAPLHTLSTADFFEGKQKNISQTALSLAKESLGTNVNEQEIFYFIYSILYSNEYRERYESFLKNSVAQIPFPKNYDLFSGLAGLGKRLVALHLLSKTEATALNEPKIHFCGKGEARVEKGYPKYENGKVMINSNRWFEDVPWNTWSFTIGGYQVCQKWLASRAAKSGKNPWLGRVLSNEDILYYRRVIVSLSETIRLMDEIDEVINLHNGWPDAFYSPPPQTIWEIIQADEGSDIEFKSTFQWSIKEGKKDGGVRKASLKTVAAFLNTSGGTLVIGVTDDKEIYGLENDFALMSKDNKKEWFRQTVVNAINRTLGEVFTNSYEFRFSDAGDGKEVFIIDVKERGPKPAFLKFDKDQEDEFFVRTDNQTVRLSGSKQYEYIQTHW